MYRRYYLGSILNGGGAWPGSRKDASVADWLALSQRFYDASMSTDMPVKIPVIWGTDAVHGHNNVHGATLFPHNIGLGAAHDPQLLIRIGRATARAVRATGITWVFAPAVAVAEIDAGDGRTKATRPIPRSSAPTPTQSSAACKATSRAATTCLRPPRSGSGTARPSTARSRARSARRKPT